MEPLLPHNLHPTSGTLRKLEADHAAFAGAPYPALVEEYIRDAYSMDLSARLGGLRLRHPFGKASGQLSLNPEQVRADAEAGLSFVVLKTVIAEAPDGSSRMEAWKVLASRMVCERITSRRGEEGWTISWIGRGWEKSLAEYAIFLAKALQIARSYEMEVLPSVKFHLPADTAEGYDLEEYQHTLGVLLEAWKGAGQSPPLVIEKDFSPTLAGSDLARQKETILSWVADVPRLTRSCAPEGEVAIGIKVMNTLFEDEFQLEILRCLTRVRPPVAFLTLFNRLFDKERHFDTVKGIAYGGHDLSDRNLSVLERWALERSATRGNRRIGDEYHGHAGVQDTDRPRGDHEVVDIPISGTGNIVSGKMMAEYALRGATSGQLHTFFQLPRSEYRSTLPRSRAALHELLFHPSTGLIATLDHLRQDGGKTGGEIRFLDLPALGREMLETRHE